MMSSDSDSGQQSEGDRSTPPEQQTFDAMFARSDERVNTSSNAARPQADTEAESSEDGHQPGGAAATSGGNIAFDDLPDPESEEVQAAAIAGRAAISPILKETGQLGNFHIPDGRVHGVADDIAGELLKVSETGHSIGRVFADWVEMLTYSLAVGNHEAEYRNTVERYAEGDMTGDERAVDHLTKAVGLLFAGVAETGTDILGDVYHQLSANSDRLGQYFTPHHVAATKAEMLMDTSVDHGYTRGDLSEEAIGARTSCHDPACGSGRLLIMAAHQQPSGVYSGVDLDSTVARMAAINLTLFNLDGQIIHGDSLTLELTTVYNTRYSDAGGRLEIADPDDTSTVVPQQ